MEGEVDEVVVAVVVVEAMRGVRKGRARGQVWRKRVERRGREDILGREELVGMMDCYDGVGYLSMAMRTLRRSKMSISERLMPLVKSVAGANQEDDDTEDVAVHGTFLPQNSPASHRSGQESRLKLKTPMIYQT